MNRWLLSRLGAEPLARLGLSLVVIGLVAEALVIAAGMIGGIFSEYTDKLLTAISTIVIAVGVWFEQVGHDHSSDEKDALVAQLRARVTDMQSLRHISKELSDDLTALLSSPLFQTEPKLNLRVGAVKDSEAQIYAMEFQRLFLSCGVNIYPTDGGGPNEVMQVAPNGDGMVLQVKSKETPIKAFVIFQHLLHKHGLKLGVQEEPSYHQDQAQLSILRKPT